MITARPARVRRARALAAVGALTVLAAGLTACSSDDNGGSGGTTPGTTSGTTATGGSTSDLAAQVAALEKPLDKYPVPTEPVTGVSSLKGKTVYYIPITQQSPQFSVTAGTLAQAMDTVGMHVQMCDGKGTPTDVSACVTQATQAKAATIITDAIPYGLAANAFAAANAAGIPVIISNQVPDDAHPATDKLAYIPAGGSQMEEALAKWVSLDSAGKASVLVNQSTDGPSPAVFLKAGKDVYAQSCADCTVTVNEVSSANFSLIAPSTSSALLKDSSVNYVESQFEQYLQPTQQGVQQAGRTGKVKGLTGAAQLSGLQELAAGGSFLYAAAAQASAYQGWVDADASFRLILGQSVPDYTIPVRLFTRDSISTVTLTDKAQSSGEWFGPATFTDDFKKLWGVA